jgi:hypothetical protein
MKWATLGCVVHACWEVQGGCRVAVDKGPFCWMQMAAPGHRATRDKGAFMVPKESLFYVLMILDVTVQVTLQQRTKAK